MDLLIQAVTLREDEFDNFNSNNNGGQPSPTSASAASNGFVNGLGPYGLMPDLLVGNMQHGGRAMMGGVGGIGGGGMRAPISRGLLDGQVVSFPSNTSKHKIHIKKNTDNLTFVKRKNASSLGGNKKPKVPGQLMPKCGFKHFADKFNDNEFDGFCAALPELVSDDLIFAACSDKKCSHCPDILSLKLLWGLIYECYPDATISDIHREHMHDNTYHYTFKLSGHRITALPVSKLYLDIMSVASQATNCTDIVLRVVSKSNRAYNDVIAPPVTIAAAGADNSTRASLGLTDSEAAMDDEPVSRPYHECIGSSLITFDHLGRILKWDINIPI